MKVGDIGILQNMHKYGRSYMNGAVAEIVAPYLKRQCMYPSGYIGCNFHYQCNVPGYHDLIPSNYYWAIDKDQIRPLSDPDAKTKETEKELIHE